MDRPLSYWVAVARKSFDNDLERNLEALGISRAELAKRLGATPAYVSKFLNGPAGNYQLRTMTKLARAVGSILQIRLIKEDGEVVRVVDYKTAAELDDALDSRARTGALDAAASDERRWVMAREGGLDVEHREQGDYAVRRPGSEGASAVEPTQAEAIERAKEIEPGVKPRVERVRHTPRGKPGRWRKA